MLRLIHMIRSGKVSPDPVSVLFHYLRGQMVNWANGKDGPIVWAADSHRGVQWLDKVEFPRKQKRYIFSPQFEIRYDTAFEEVVRACADLSREGRTWICEELIQGLVGLNKMGFAHSYEAWNDGKLVGGGFGVQIGSMLSCDSMFHRMSNASKAAYGQMLVHAQKRGFKIVDTNGVATHQVNYGEEWTPRWRFQQLIFESLRDRPSLTDDRPCPELPWEVKAMLPALRVTRTITRRLPWFKERAVVALQADAAPENEAAVTPATPTATSPVSAAAPTGKAAAEQSAEGAAAASVSAAAQTPLPTKPQPPASRAGGDADPIRVVA